MPKPQAMKLSINATGWRGRTVALAVLLAVVSTMYGTPSSEAISSRKSRPRPVGLDLKVSRIAADRKVAVAGGKVHIRYTVRNIGRKRAGRFFVAFTLSRSRGSQGRAFELPGRPARRGLSGRGATAGSVRLTVPVSVPAGSYWTVACADEPSRWAELREGNNCRASDRRLTVRARSAKDQERPPPGPSPGPQPAPDPEPGPPLVPTPGVNPLPGPGPIAGLGSEPVLLAAGDIASCSEGGDEATAALLDRLSGVVAALGDTVYEHGTLDEYINCYEPSWGRHKARTRPTLGNHEYATPGASGYFSYFGAAAGEAPNGWYSYDVGAWHIVALNGECADVACGPGSPQSAWLLRDLAEHPTTCTLAYWHRPRFTSSSAVPPWYSMSHLWDILHTAGAEVVLSGHAHDYERFSPQTSAGVADPVRGIRQFTVGTGGKALHRTSRLPATNSEVRNDQTLGVLRLRLHPTSYDWEFLAVAGKTFTDSGSQACH